MTEIKIFLDYYDTLYHQEAKVFAALRCLYFALIITVIICNPSLI